MTEKIFTEQQREAVRAVGEWRRSGGRPWFVLNGSAGTGKTTIAETLASGGGRVLFAAPTGKAASVLTSKGCPATTVHSLIYTPKHNSAGTMVLELKKEEKDILSEIEAEERHREDLRHQLREVREKMRRAEAPADRPHFSLKEDSDLRGADLLIVDESSMVDPQMGEDILLFNVPVLALGDPYQLPPVGGPGFFSQKEDFLLTQVHRQALGSPIIALADLARCGRPFPPGFSESGLLGSARVLSHKPTPEDVMSADQILCGRNATRVSLNRRVRQLRDITDPLPTPGERLICLQNDNEIGLTNGSIWTVESVNGSHVTDRIVMDLVSEDGQTKMPSIVSHTAYFLGEKPERWETRDAQHFDYGYAITVHKAQGSQWDKVVVFDDWGNQDRSKWLYTAVTRAAKDLLVVQQ